MKKIRFASLFILPLAIVSLTGCTIYDIFGISSEAKSNVPEGNYASDFDPNGTGYYKAEGKKSMTPFSYRDVNYTTGMDNVDSTGKAKLLCIPIEFTDYPFYGASKSAYTSKETMYSDLDIAFNGEASDTKYWESLSSFYQKSSYGKFDLEVEIADIYSTGETTSEFRTADRSSAYEAGHVVETVNAALESVRAAKGDDYVQQFDTDNDGWVDGIIMIYSCPDAYSDRSIQSIDQQASTFWAYCYWAATEYGTEEEPIPNLFFWASHSFLHQAAKQPKVDCHTIIHEFGHMLGLDDYYASGGSTWNPAGGLLMMDENILDHDLFSKTALGWTEPYVVTGKQDVSLTISPSQTNGDCIVIPAGDCWNQTAFSEYLILDLYTPDGLNELDSTRAYSNRELGYTEAGVRIYHVDARLAVTSGGSDPHWTYYYKDTLKYNKSTVGYTGAYSYFQIAASNCYKDASRCDEDFSLLALISQDNKKNFRKGAVADNDSLFQTGDSFTFSKYSSYFPNGEKWNDGSSTNLTISFTSVSSDSATITFSF